MAEPRTDRQFWVAVRVLCGKEVSIESHLQRRAITTFLPVHRVKHRWSDREKVIEEALFQGYLFAFIFPFEARSVVTTPGVMEILSLRGEHVEVELGVIEALRGIVERSSDPLPKGSKVQIIDGPYQGWLGEVERTSGEERVMVLLRMLNGVPWHVEASTFDLRKVEAALAV